MATSSWQNYEDYTAIEVNLSVADQRSSVLRSLASGFGGKFFRIVLNPDTLAPRLRAAQVQVSHVRM